RFAVYNGTVTYQCKFLCSRTLEKNRAANRIVVPEFATKSVPDPCRTIFDRFASIFNPGEHMTDNAVISVYPFGDEVYALTEVPIMFRIDPVTLDTLERKNLMGSVVMSHTAHPHVMPNGDVYNIGAHSVKGRLKLLIVKFPYKEKGDMFKSAEVVATVTPRWFFHPTYMHSFGISENYFILIEQPMSLSISKYIMCQMKDEGAASALNWYPEYETHIVLVNRNNGRVKRYRTETVFFLHTINCFEENGNVVVDLCTYSNAKILDVMYVDAIKKNYSDIDYIKWCSTRPKRYVIPTEEPDMTLLTPMLIVDVPCEMPRINYEMCNGRPYRYFYGLRADVDNINSGGLLKVDTITGDIKTWRAPNSYPSEPVFVARPGAIEEDDGVILSAVLWGDKENTVDLLVLDARTFTEIGRATFETPSPAPKCFHGWFLSNNPTFTK
ncbi:unnamed protein product, partial [Leptidea sinapis]